MFKGDPSFKLKGIDISILAKSIDIILYTKFPKYNDLNIYLKKIAQICITLQIPIPWVLPNGLQVMQSYVKANELRLKPFKFRKNTFILKNYTDIFNKRKQIRALMPNLIHSLDATSLALITEIFFSNTNTENLKTNQNTFINFYTIHDCFATTANKVESLNNNLKMVYFKIYSNDNYLLKFDRGIKEFIKLHYGNEAFNYNENIIEIEGLNLEFPNINEIISLNRGNNLLYNNMLKSVYSLV